MLRGLELRPRSGLILTPPIARPVMSFHRVPPAWQLPEGVDRPLWQYTHTPRLAAEEDAYFADNLMFRADAQALDERFVTPGRLVDLGCGVGRHAIRFASPRVPRRRG